MAEGASLQPSEGKAGKTPSKLDSALRAAVDRLKGRPAEFPPRRGAGVDVDADGKALVDIQAKVTPDLTAAITAAGGVVISQFPEYESIRARVPLSKLESLAEHPDVRSIRTADRPITNPRVDPSMAKGERRCPRIARSLEPWSRRWA
jgi:hypothetical protein